MTGNETLRNIGERLKAAEEIYLLPHILADGDTLGSCVALCAALRRMGKRAFVLTEDKIPEYLLFLCASYCVDIEEVKAQGKEKTELAICVDCGGLPRFPLRADFFQASDHRICIDHHPESMGFGDQRYVDPQAAATGEIIFDLLRAMEAPIDREMAEALFAAITTDTGNYQYANTTIRSHEITMELYKAGLNANKISVALYENESLNKMQLHSRIIRQAELFAEGEGVLSILTQEMLRETGTLMEDSEGAVATLRSIRGVQIAVLIREQEDGRVKFSLRSKERGDVGSLSARYGGGGHLRAAGFTMEGIDLEEARRLVIAACEEELKKTAE